MRPTFRAVAVGVALLLAVPACGDDDTTGTETGNSSPQPSSAGGEDTTTTTADEPTSTTVATPLRMTPEGLGELLLGMTIAEATATGLVGDFTPSCEIVGQGQQGAPLLAPLDGHVFTVSDGTVSHIDVRAGAVTDPGGVGPGDDVAAATKAFEDAGYAVELDKDLEDAFAAWFLRVTDGGETVFGATVTPATGALTSVSVPSTLLCD